jgi:hypothetical protein
LDTLLKHFFPANRPGIFPPEDRLEPFIYITHFVLSRHFEYGRDLCLDLMQEAAVQAAQATGVATFLAPERTAIAVQAILLTLHAIEREEPTPTWPSCTEFSVVPSLDDYPSSSDFISASVLSKPGMQDLFDRCGATLSAMAISCGHTVGQMSIFDDQWSQTRLNPSHEESQIFVVRRHAEATVAYPTHLVPQISMLQTCFQSWPRCLHPTLPLNDAIDLLLRGLMHVEPSIRDAASAALKRVTADPPHALAVLSRYTAYLFNPLRITQEGSGTKLLIECIQLLDLWVAFVDSWIRSLIARPRESITEDDKKWIYMRNNEIETGVLFLLSHETRSIHSAGVKVARLLGLLLAHFSPDPSSPNTYYVRFVELLNGKSLDKSYLYGYDDLLDRPELDRLDQWRQSTREDIPLRIIDSINEKDRKLWRFVFPRFMQCCMDRPTQVLTTFREIVVAAASRYHPYISHLAGLSSKVPAGLPTRSPLVERDGPSDKGHLVDQWHTWVKILSSTATLLEPRPALTHIGREHSRAPSDANFERERLTTTRGLFRYLTPFLDSEHTAFRDAAVLCISSLPPTAYPQLLEDLSHLATRQFESRSKSGTSAEQNSTSRQPHDEPRSKTGATLVVERTRRQERLHSAVARIYYLTSHLLPHQRSAGKQAALANVLKFVRNAQSYLTSPEIRDNYSLQRLRRYFCGTVERLFDGLGALRDSDRFFLPNIHLALYRMCEEWCQFGPQSEGVKQRLLLMQRAVAANDSQDPNSVERFQHETRLLSNAAVGAMASLCVSLRNISGRSLPSFLNFP